MIFELFFNLLVDDSVKVKYPSIIILNFFFALILAMYFLKKDTLQNRYLKQRIDDYYLYALTQMFVLIVFNVITALISGIFTFLFSTSPAANGIMILVLMTTSWIGTAIAFICRSQWTSRKYIAAVSLLVIVLFSLVDSTNTILVYINWILPPVSTVVTTFQEHSKMVALLPLALRQFIYALILFGISLFFNKKSYAK